MKRDWRYYLGITLLIFNLISYPLIALLSFLKLSTATVATLTGGIIVADELAFLGAIALLGKEFFEKIKAKFKSWFARPAAPPQPVSKRRHYVGVAMLLFSFLPYFAAEFLLILGSSRDCHLRTILLLLLGSDALFLASLFVLGADFWERLKKLFQWSPPDALLQAPSG